MNCNDESLLRPVLINIVKRYPDIYTKSLAATIGEKQVIIEKAFQKLCDGIVGLGFAISQKRVS